MTPSLRAGTALLCAAVLVRHAAAQDTTHADGRSRRDTLLPDNRFRIAIRQHPDSAELQLEFARWYRRQPSPWMRMQATEHFREAIRLATAKGDHGMVADAETELARTAWVSYERLANSYQLIGNATAFNIAESLDRWRYVEDFFAHQALPLRPDRGEMEYVTAEGHARAALAAEPGHLSATGLLGVILGDRHRWEEIVTPARSAIRAHPDAPDGYRVLGLALWYGGRIGEAARAFAAALARMSPEQRRPYENLGANLRHAEQAHYDSLTPDQRAELRHQYWAVAQPLALDSVNPVQVEYYARVTYVDLRWTVPEEGLVGWQSDRGSIWLRYGPPEIWATLPGGMTDSNFLTIWVYPRRHTRFVFQGTASYVRASFMEDYAWFADEARAAAPVRFDNVPAVAEMDTIVAQLAQFRGPAGGTSLAVFGFVPVGRMLSGVDLASVDLELGAIVQDQWLRDVARRVATERLRVGDSTQMETRTWRLDLVPDQYLLRLEARERATHRAARSLTRVAVERFGAGALALSDVVLADRIAPRDSDPQRWTGYLIDPSAGRVGHGARIAFLWELYNLTGDSAGFGRFRVNLEIAVRAIERHGFTARIVGGLADAAGMTVLGDTLVGLTYERAADVRGREAIPNHLDVELRDAPDGQYTATVMVTDLRTGTVARRQREFVVTATPGDAPPRVRE
jgi:GWxTD domain-containing protein